MQESRQRFTSILFEYEPAKGFNLGMVNDVRFLKITNFVPSDVPKQVKEICNSSKNTKE